MLDTRPCCVVDTSCRPLGWVGHDPHPIPYVGWIAPMATLAKSHSLPAWPLTQGACPYHDASRWWTGQLLLSPLGELQFEVFGMGCAATELSPGTVGATCACCVVDTMWGLLGWEDGDPVVPVWWLTAHCWSGAGCWPGCLRRRRVPWLCHAIRTMLRNVGN